MDIDELRTVQSKERRKDSLQHLHDSFYDDVAAYIAGRKGERDDRAAAVDNPFSDSEVRKLSDEIETAEEVAESLYERRVGKVVKLASFAAADAPVETEGMTTQELDLFEDLVARIRSNKEAVLDVLADGPGAAAGSAAPDTAETSAAADPDRAAPTDVADANPVTGDVDPTDADPTPAEAGADAGGGVLADAMGGDEATAGSAADADTASDSTRDATGGEASPEPSDRAGTADRTEPGGATPSTDTGDGPEATTGTDDDRPVPPGGPTPDRTPAAEEGGGADRAPEGGAERSGGGAPDADPATDGASVGGPDDADDTTDERTTVRIIRDVGRILGVDEREYDLASEDVVSLPAANAGPLVERDAAEPLE